MYITAAMGFGIATVASRIEVLKIQGLNFLF
jgi:hypothetical protein